MTTIFSSLNLLRCKGHLTSAGRVICDQGKLVTEGGGRFIKRVGAGELNR